MEGTTAPSAPSRISSNGSRRAPDLRYKAEVLGSGFHDTSIQIPDVDVDVEDLVDACMSGSEVYSPAESF